MPPLQGAFLFTTTTVGSLPKPSWLAEPEVLWAPWQLEGERLAEGKRDAVRMASGNPARLLGIGNKKGCLASGADADMAILNTDTEVAGVVARGRFIRF